MSIINSPFINNHPVIDYDLDVTRYEDLLDNDIFNYDETEVKSESPVDDGCTDLINRMRKSLFPKIPTLRQWGITVNIQPTKKMNKRLWKLYDHDKQRDILNRIESKFRRDTPSVKLIELHFEVCPTLKNIHFHALYEAPVLFRAEMETYYKRVCCSDDEHTKKPWRYLDIKEIVGGSDEWLKYIRKDLKQ